MMETPLQMIVPTQSISYDRQEEKVSESVRQTRSKRKAYGEESAKLASFQTRRPGTSITSTSVAKKSPSIQP